VTKRVLVVVSDPSDLPELGAERLVSADRYLEGGEGLAEPGSIVVNLCRSFRYRSKGYYVSLLAAARGQHAVPSVETIEALASPFGLFRALEEAGVPTSPGEANGLVEALAVFGEARDPRFQALAAEVYRVRAAPLLRLRLAEEVGGWAVAEVAPVAPQAVPTGERGPLVDLLRNEKRLRRLGRPAPREEVRASIAVLVDETDPFSPSDAGAIDRLERVASAMNVHVRRIAPGDLGRLGEYDALFIRTLTGVREPSFAFALRAEALGMPVIDDPQSIIRCSNKVFLEELLRREGIPTPRTLVLTSRARWAQVESALGTPVVVKLPDSSFSAAVHRISSLGEYEQRVGDMLRRSPLLIAQEYLPTDFDWRITVLDGRLLFAARYHMARGHWQIRTEDEGTERYGDVEAVPRGGAPQAVVEVALRAAALIGEGLYGVDIKETARGPVVIEINDNPNLDRGEEDAADGDRVYEDLLGFFLRRIEEGAAERQSEVTPRARPSARHYRPYEVAGMELEYAVVDGALEPASRVADTLKALAGRATSDAVLGPVEVSNEIADHVLELKVAEPVRSLAEAEEALQEGVRRTSAVLRERFGARLLPTGMHPWMDPARARLWSRSNGRIYATYARVFDVRTHGWTNVHASHLNLPLGREPEGVAMLNAAALLIPYLPALAASSPVHDGRIQEAVDGRLAWILRHQERLPESQGTIVPEFASTFAAYRKEILQPMYRALDEFPDTQAIRHEFLNARGAVLRFSRRTMELRVLDVQECVGMDVAIGVFARSALRYLARRIQEGRLTLPEHRLLVADFHATVRGGSRARVIAPHLAGLDRGDDGRADVREVLESLLEGARRSVRRDEAHYLQMVERVIRSGTLSERIREALAPSAGDEAELRTALRRVYGELAECLERNEPWSGRWAAVPAVGRDPGLERLAG
jgi:glutathione synthase/RimK-type ligase-like ATP-grasp enzyme/gamma-glutamyl:cysteine ligase YbdK (ATP-grasp superfamily)